MGGEGEVSWSTFLCLFASPLGRGSYTAWPRCSPLTAQAKQSGEAVCRGGRFCCHRLLMGMLETLAM